MPLDFETLRTANLTRCDRWHTPGTEPWTAADWSNAMMGEVGEVAEVLAAIALLWTEAHARFGEAANIVKKLRRAETGVQGAADPPQAVLKRMLAKELADAHIYCDLLAAYFGIDTGEAIRDTFNQVSEREGFPDRL